MATLKVMTGHSSLMLRMWNPSMGKGRTDVVGCSFRGLGLHPWTFVGNWVTSTSLIMVMNTVFMTSMQDSDDVGENGASPSHEASAGSCVGSNISC